MKSVIEYARAEYPEHEIRVWSPGGRASSGLAEGLASDDLVLQDHTVVAQVIGSEATRDLARQMYDAGWSSTVALLVTPSEPAVLTSEPVDRDGVTDLPKRRPAAAAAVGAVIGAAMGAVAAGIWSGHVLAAVIAGCFGAIMGAWVGAMFGGLGRHAGERAWRQPNAPGRTMGLVATRTDDEAEATRAAHVMEEAAPHDVRIVSAGGSWHLPLT